MSYTVVGTISATGLNLLWIKNIDTATFGVGMALLMTLSFATHSYILRYIFRRIFNRWES
jgi:hypothetical protein